MGIFAALIGILLAIATGVVPSIAFVLAPVLIVAFVVIVVSRPVRNANLAAFAWLLIGAGGAFLYGVVNTVAACQGTADFCGSANVIPLLALAAGLIPVGSLLAAAVRRRASRAP